ncbi:MAG: hypothetical protein ACYDG2_02165, partial [Ruminiclostridium sp.]
RYPLPKATTKRLMISEQVAIMHDAKYLQISNDNCVQQVEYSVQSCPVNKRMKKGKLGSLNNTICKL